MLAFSWNKPLAPTLQTFIRITPEIMDQAHSQIDSAPYHGQIISLDRSTRWQVRQRLQELDILCECLADGRLRVLANTPVSLMQVRSVLQQWSMSRSGLVRQLEACWKTSS